MNFSFMKSLTQFIKISESVPEPQYNLGTSFIQTQFEWENFAR